MEYYRKHAKDGEILIYQEFLDKFSDKYNAVFDHLVLPKSLSIDPDNKIITLPNYNGEKFNDKWNELTGGSLLGLDLTVDVPLLLKDLSSIDIEKIITNPKLKDVKNLVFDNKKYTPKFKMLLKKFLELRLLNNEEVEITKKLVSKDFKSKLLFNNGDFYPRNFIRLANRKIVLIDWDTRSESSRANIIDYVENIAAFCLVHFWGNQSWQKTFVNELRKYFAISKEDFQKALLIKSLEQANFWLSLNRNDLCDDQIKIFKNALSETYISSLFD